MPELGLVRVGPAPAGVGLVGLFLGPAVRHLERLERDGLAVDHGHDVDGTGIRDAADAPEDKDQDDDAEGEFDAQRLRVGTDEVEHVFSAEKERCRKKPCGSVLKPVFLAGKAAKLK